MLMEKEQPSRPELEAETDCNMSSSVIRAAGPSSLRAIIEGGGNNTAVPVDPAADSDRTIVIVRRLSTPAADLERMIVTARRSSTIADEHHDFMAFLRGEEKRVRYSSWTKTKEGKDPRDAETAKCESPLSTYERMAFEEDMRKKRDAFRACVVGVVFLALVVVVVAMLWSRLWG